MFWFWHAQFSIMHRDKISGLCVYQALAIIVATGIQNSSDLKQNLQRLEIPVATRSLFSENWTRHWPHLAVLNYW